MSGQHCSCHSVSGCHYSCTGQILSSSQYLPNDVDSTSASTSISTVLPLQPSCRSQCSCQKSNCWITSPDQTQKKCKEQETSITKHHVLFFQTLDVLRHNNALCDVTLVCEGSEIPAHKVVLASCCPYFRTMFLGSFPESTADRIEIQGVEASALETLVDFMYTSGLHLCKDNVESILSAANLLQMDIVKSQCCQLLQNQLQASNCLQIWQISDLYSCDELKEKVESYIQEHFSEVVMGPNFLLLSKERVERIISSDILTVSTEEKVYEAVMLWTKHDVEQRSQFLADLLQHVRFTLLPMKYLVLQVKEDPLISTSLKCSKLVMEAMSHLMLKENPNSGGSDVVTYSCMMETKPRMPAGVEQVMLVFGGEDDAALATLECYAFRDRNWQSAQPTPLFLCKAGCVVYDGKVYLIGGYNGSRQLRTVVCYDPFADVYSYVSSMHYMRSEVGAAVLDGKIYAVGGFDGTSYLRTAECYDRCDNRWRMISPMPGGGKSAVGVGTANGMLYVVGGIDRDSLVGTMECYDPKLDSWTVVPGVKCPKKYVGVAELGGLLYLAGGRYSDESSSLKVHCFDPKTNKLKQVKDMPCTFPSPSLLAHNDILYVDGRIKFLSYNPQTDLWLELRGKSVYRHHSMAAIVDRPIKV